MMVRMKTWIDRLSRARRRQCGAREVAAPRRRLMFEHCESRLALSAAMQAALPYGSDAIAASELATRLWMRVPDTQDWVQVSFGSVANSGAESSIRVELNFNPVPVQTSLSEGGSISVDSDAVGIWQNTLTLQLSNWAVRAAFQDYGASAGQTVESSLVLNRGELHVNIGKGILDSAGFDFTDGWADGPTTYDDLLGETDASPTVDPGPSAPSSPILRITAPITLPSAEGGTIDLTAMAGPTKLFNDPPASQLVARSEGVPAAAGRTALRTSSSIESLRARAVVYEVGLERDRDSKATPASKQFEPTVQSESQDSGNGEAARKSSTLPVAQQQAAGEGDQPATEAVSGIEAGRGATMPEAAPAANESARRAVDARDAALGAWGDDARRSARDGKFDFGAEAGLALADARGQHVGMAVALAFGAAPLIKRTRRTRSTPLDERNAGLS